MSPQTWWESRRLHYNLGLLFAGILAFICYVAVCVTLLPRVLDPDEIEIGGIEAVAQGIVYLLMMGVANICYFLGPLSEVVVGPANVDRYRRVTYSLGFWFSVLLPLSIPVLLAIVIVFFPDYYFFV